MILTPGHIAAITATERITLRKEGFRHSAVLVPVVRIGEEDHLLLTRRSEHLPHHRGQIAFPGGAMDDGETVEQTALREAFEEVRLLPEAVQIICCLNDIWTPSEYIISPVLARILTIEGLEANPDEVDRIFTVPLGFFADNANAETKQIEVNGYERLVYYYHFGGEKIWGATAFIIRDLLQKMGVPV